MKDREIKPKNIRWDYIGKYTSEKTKGIIKNIGEKKRKKERKNTEPRVERKIE